MYFITTLTLNLHIIFADHLFPSNGAPLKKLRVLLLKKQ